MNQVVTTTTRIDVNFRTNGSDCDEATQTISFIIEPSVIATLTSDELQGFDREACTSEPMEEIIFELANPAYTLTVTPLGDNPFPPGVSGTPTAQQQISRIEIVLDGSGITTTQVSDTFEISVTGVSKHRKNTCEVECGLRRKSKDSVHYIPPLLGHPLKLVASDHSREMVFGLTDSPSQLGTSK